MTRLIQQFKAGYSGGVVTATMCNRLPPDLESYFPNLDPARYTKTSDPDIRYNCVAWAAKWDKTHWWESAGEPGMYWPDEVPKGFFIENYVRLFGYLGYIPCDNSNLESGFEKVAIYGDSSGVFTHVAKQLPDGNWTSKLGPEDDIQHTSLDVFSGSDYGLVVRIMKRTIASAGQMTV